MAGNSKKMLKGAFQNKTYWILPLIGVFIGLVHTGVIIFLNNPQNHYYSFAWIIYLYWAVVFLIPETVLYGICSIFGYEIGDSTTEWVVVTFLFTIVFFCLIDVFLFLLRKKISSASRME